MLANYSLLNQAQLIISALILLTSFILLVQNRINSMVTIFAWQSGFLAAVTVLQAIAVDRFELYISAFIILLLKVLFVPSLLRYFVKRLNIRHKVAVIAHPFLLLIGAVILVLFCYHLTTPLRLLDSAFLLSSNATAVAMTVTLLGMVLLITHRKAISHVIGFMAMENGIFFAALVSAHGMPMAVELGIAFDVLVAAILFGVFFFHMRSSIDSLDVDRLNLLREDAE